jgi:hypothetical protein
MKMAVLWDAAPCSLVEVTEVSDVFAASKTSVSFYQATRRCNPEDRYNRNLEAFLELRRLTYRPVYETHFESLRATQRVAHVKESLVASNLLNVGNIRFVRRRK